MIRQARRVLATLESQAVSHSAQPDLFAAPLPVFEAEPEPPVPSACLAALLALDPDSLTPREALDALYRLKGLL